jgi:gas vesicle protein
MSDIPDPQEEQTPENLASEFQNLGDNLKKMFLGAWESEQRKNLQKEIEEGLAGLGNSLKQTANEIQESETGQRVKSEAEDLRDRVRSGEVETKIRSDLQSVLHNLNKELEKVIRTAPPSEESGEEEAGDE